MATRATDVGIDALGVRQSRATLGQRRRASLLRSIELWVPAGYFIVLAGACFLWPLVYHLPSPTNTNLALVNLPPLSPGHLLGTDFLGRDTLSRILYGGRVSLEVGLGVNALSFVIGGTLGALAGFKGGWMDLVVSRVFDVCTALPTLVLALVIVKYLGLDEIHVIWALAFYFIPGYGRLALARALRVREQQYVLSATLSGVRDFTMVRRHLAPNVVAQLVTFGLLGVGTAMTFEALLSFLGYGVPFPAPSWGSMIAIGDSYLPTNPALVLVPAAFLFSAIVSVNLVSEALRARWSEL